MRTTISKPTMPILLDKILPEYADQAFEKAARLRRDGAHTARDLVSAKMLAELEATGDAMRYTPTVKLPGRLLHGCAIILWTFGSTRRPILRMCN